MNDQVDQQDTTSQPSQTPTNQTRISSSTHPDGRIILTMGKHNNSLPSANESSASNILESTEKSDIPMAKDVKPRKRRGTKSRSSPQPPPRRSKRHISERPEDKNDFSAGQIQSSQVNDTTTKTPKSKSRATITKSTSPPSASTTPRSSRPNKRKNAELEENQAPSSTQDEDNQPSQESTGTTGPPAKKQRKSRATKSATPSVPTRFSKRKASSSEKSVSLPVLTDQEEVDEPNMPLPPKPTDETPAEASSEQGSMNGYDSFNDPNYAVYDDEDGLDDVEADEGPARRKSSNIPKRATSVPASSPSLGNSKRKASELEEDEAGSTFQAANGEPAEEVAKDDGHSFKKARTLSSSTSSSLASGAPAITLNDASEEATDMALADDTEAVEDGAQNAPTKKRGRPAGGRPAISRPKIKPTKKAAPGRRKKTSEDVRVQAAYDRMVELKKRYKELAKGLKPALAMLADRSVEAMLDDPKAHENVSEFKAVRADLDARHNTVVTVLEKRRQMEEDHAKKKWEQEFEYSNMKARCALQDIVDRSIARAKEAFVNTNDAGVRNELVEDDNVSVTLNRDTHLRDLNDFNAPDDAEAASAIEVDPEQAGTSTPRGKKSPFKKRLQNNDPAPKMAPVAKHSLLAATQEQEPSSVPPSRAATPEPMEPGVFDEYGVHIPNRVRRGRMAEPNNRAIVEPWIDYDEWDIQAEVIAAKKKPKDHASKPSHFYLDQTSFTSQGGGGYKLGTNRPEDFNEELIKRHNLHPVYGIPIKGSTNPDNVVPPTDFSKPLDDTRPVVVVDVEETRPKTPGGTRKPAELREPLELSRSVSIINAGRNFEDFLIRQRFANALKEIGYEDEDGGGYPSVKGYATFDAAKRDRQKAEDGVQDILDANDIVEETEAKEASAAAAAVAANIAHKSSINAIVNSEDEMVGGPVSYMNRQRRKSHSTRRGSLGPSTAPGLDALNDAIKIRTSQTPGIPPRGYFSGPQPIHYGNQPMEYIPQGRNLPPRPPQSYIQHPNIQHPVPMQQQMHIPPQAVVPTTQPPAPFNNGPHHTPQQHQHHMHQQPAQFNSIANPLLQPRFMAPTGHPSWYDQPPQAQPMPPPPPPRAYQQFNHYVPAQQRQPEQLNSQAPHPQANQSSSRQHRQLRPAPPQAGTEWGPRNTQDAGQSYRNVSPLPTYQAPPPQGPYQNPTAFAWPQQPHPMQQQMQMQPSLPPPSAAQQILAPPPNPAQQQQLPPLSPAQPQHPQPTHGHSYTSDFTAINGPARATPTGDYQGEEDSPRKKSTASKRGGKRK